MNQTGHWPFNDKAPPKWGLGLLVPETGNATRFPVAACYRRIALKRRCRKVFGTSASRRIATRDVMFRQAKAMAKVENLRFHDSRAEASWRLSKKLEVLELARVDRTQGQQVPDDLLPDQRRRACRPAQALQPHIPQPLRAAASPGTARRACGSAASPWR